MARRLLCSLLVLSMFIITMTWIPEIPVPTPIDSELATENNSSPKSIDDNELTPLEDEQLPRPNLYNLAYDSPVDGILNPVIVEQSGYAASPNISARTDSNQNLGYDLPLDVAHSWIANEAEVSVWNLEKLYAVNGSYSEGIPGTNVNPNGTVEYYPLGWSADSIDGPSSYADDVQLAAYDSTGRQYVTVESQGAKEGQNAFAHVAGTRIVWTQFVQNTPYTEDFIFSFDYFYLRGPIDGPDGNDDPIGNCSITLFIDGINVWNMSLLLLSQRGVWLSTGDIPLTISGVPSSFLLELGLVIDEELVLDKRDDYDGDPGHIADGIGNSAYITVYLDDVSLIKAIPPTAEQVQLEFVTGGVSEALTGSMGVYYASIPNASYWITTPISVTLTANTSVSFDYKTRLYSHRFTDSNWRTNIGSVGVSYTIDHGLSAELTFYAYVGYLGQYENPEMTIVFPSDWENLTVSDPFLTDLTSTCIISSGSVTVPTSIIDRLGWWEVKLQSPNYVKSIKQQIFDATWSDSTTFRIGNETRADVTIGTDTETMGPLTAVNVSWFNPSDQIWAMNQISGGILGQIYSGSFIFNSSSPAGEWYVEVYWTNGTEVAYDRGHFEVHHSANLVAEPSEITTDAGLKIKGIVRYTDGDTGAYLMDTSATIEGNWSASIVPFNAISVRNWWEADFDTSLVGAGKFSILVTATREYYDPASCIISVHSINVTRLTSPNAPWTAAELGSIVDLTFKYESYHTLSDTWTHVRNLTDVAVAINWTSGYWSVSEDSDLGIYQISLDSTIINSGTHLLNVTFSKPNHQSKTLFLTLILSPMTSSLIIFDGFSDRIDLEEPKTIKLGFMNKNDYPVQDANVLLDSWSPSSGLNHTGITNVVGEEGNYSITLTPYSPTVFTIRFVATGTNVEPAIAVFVLVVNDVGTRVDIPGTGSVSIGLTDVYNTTFRYEMLNGTGIDNADISVIYSGGTPGALSWYWIGIGGGDYSIEFNSIASGTYLVTIAAYKQYYQRATNAFFLIVGAISTNMNSLNGTGDTVSFGRSYNIVISYTNGSGFGLDGANVSVVSVSPSTGLPRVNGTPHGSGIYSILLTPLEDNLFTILIQATLDNHETGFVQFALNVNPIATTLSALNASAEISLDQTFSIFLHFQDEDLNSLENGTISILSRPTGTNISEFEDLGDGYYSAIITPLRVGTFDFIFRASKDGYQNDTVSFTLSAIRIQTILRTATGFTSASTQYGQICQLIVFYERNDNIKLNVTNAEISVQGASNAISWTYTELAQGGYQIDFETRQTGNWTILISASKENHIPLDIPFQLEITLIPIRIQLLTPRFAMEGKPFNITVRIFEVGTNRSINATVTYRFSQTGSGVFQEMEYAGDTGLYTITIPLRLFSSPVYRLEINAVQENYKLLQLFDEAIIVDIDILGRNTMLISTSSGVGISLVVFFIALRIYSGRKKKQLNVDLANKRRFDDADNLIGVIVLHKKSGIPIYSKIPKGGFDEGIVAAFVSAVTHFREEFEMFDEEQMQVIPISDIIRAVQTRNLICAFITVKSASLDQNRRMEAYGMQVGTYLDDIFEDRPSSIVDNRINEMLDYIFDTTLDGHLVKYYKIAITEVFPKRYRFLEELMTDVATRHCSKPVYLAQGVSTYGIPPAKGCTLVLEAIDKGLIEICEEHEIQTTEKEFKDFFKGSAGKAKT